jgi:hypothetical protein
VKEDGCSNFILTVVASATGSAKKAAVEALHISLRALSRCYQRFPRQCAHLPSTAFVSSGGVSPVFFAGRYGWAQNCRSGLNALGRPPGTAPAQHQHRMGLLLEMAAGEPMQLAVTLRVRRCDALLRLREDERKFGVF